MLLLSDTGAAQHIRTLSKSWCFYFQSFISKSETHCGLHLMIRHSCQSPPAISPTSHVCLHQYFNPCIACNLWHGVQCLMPNLFILTFSLVEKLLESHVWLSILYSWAEFLLLAVPVFSLTTSLSPFFGTVYPFGYRCEVYLSVEL